MTLPSLERTLRGLPSQLWFFRPSPGVGKMSRHRVGVRQDDYDEDDYYSQSPGSYPGDSLSSSVERQYMFNRCSMHTMILMVDSDFVFG